MSPVMSLACVLHVCPIRHLLRNAGRLLHLTLVDGVEALTLIEARDDDSLASTIASDSVTDVGRDTVHLATVDLPGVADTRRSSTMSRLDLAERECRIRRLEGGRVRAEEARRAVAVERRIVAARQYREMCSTGDTQALDLATASFRYLTWAGNAKQAHPISAGLSQQSLRALRERVEREMSCEEKLRAEREQLGTGTRDHRKSRTWRQTRSGQEGILDVLAEDPCAASGCRTDRRDTHMLVEDSDCGDTCQSGASIGDKASEDRPARSSHRQQLSVPCASENDASEVSLADLLLVVDDLVRRTEQNSLSLAAFVAWWVGAVSEAELALKRRFMTAPRG